MSGRPPSVLVVAPSCYLLGGIQTWLDYLLPGLKEKGWEVTLGLTAGEFHDTEAYLSEHPFAKVERIENKTGSRTGRRDAIAALLARQSPDLVLSLNIVDVYPAIAIARAKGRFDGRVVATFHGFGSDYLADFQLWNGEIDAIVATNKLARELVCHATCIDAKRVYYAPYGVTRQPWSAERDRPWDVRHLRLGYAGRFDVPQKRVFDVVDIVTAATKVGLSVELTVAGDGPEKTKFLERIAQSGMASRFSDLGRLLPEDLANHLYRQIDVLLVTSTWETGPIVAWEAMIEGVALLTSDYIGRKREGSLNDGENCRVFPVGDINLAVQALRELSDEREWRRIAKAGHQMVSRRYTRQVSIDRWSEVLEEIMCLPDRPHHRDRDDDVQIPQVGRLDRWLGVELAEHVRAFAGRSFVHRSPGGEWPHSYGPRESGDEGLAVAARELERAGTTYEPDLQP